MSQTYIFHREGSWYPLNFEDDNDAAMYAANTPETLKVTDAQGSRTVWEVPNQNVPAYHRINLPCGFAFASVSKDIKPETIAALDEMAKAAMKQFGQKETTIADKLNAALKRIDELGLTLMDRPVKRLDETPEAFVEKYKIWYGKAYDVLNQK